MIPITLILKNFMSYGEEYTTLPFAGLHVACLSGDNGNGKTALLDAITWSLWGKTRASAVRGVTEDDLIRVGADEMEVRFEFELNGQQYRVVRKRKRGKAGGEWQFSQRDAAATYVSIGGNTQRETGREIVKLLNMEYETFINSAYLQQGRADEFTRQTPDNRKRILGEILGLERYDRLEAKARECARALKETADELEGELRLLDAEIATQGRYEAELEEARERLACAEAEVGVQVRVTADLSDRRSRLAAHAQRVAEAEIARARIAADLAERVKERQAQEVRLATLRKVLDQREAVLKDYESLQGARRRRDTLTPDIEAFNRATADLNTLIGAINVEKARLMGELTAREAELGFMEQQSEEAAVLRERIAELDAALRDEIDIQARIAAALPEQERAQQRFGELSARHKQLDAAIVEVDEILELLSRPQASCPVCDSDLAGQRQQDVVAKQRGKRDRLAVEKEETRRLGIAAKKAVAAAQAALDELNARLRGLAAERSRRDELARRLEELRSATVGLEKTRTSAVELRAQIEKEQFAAPKRIQRGRLEQDLERLRASKAEYETLVQRIRNLDATEQRYQQLRLAEDGWESEVATSERLTAAVAAKEVEQSAAVVALDGLRAQLAGYDEVCAQAEAADRELGRLRAEVGKLGIAVARSADAVARCKRAADEKQRRGALHRRADEERRLYQALAVAFGRRGVQALIVENAIPEIVDEANQLLLRMTDTAMQVAFETTRAAKATLSEIETLDIRITDEAGTRPYELFSGGEAFRVNFAIRIALSRLLARRSGARLQTLILDEGFGSQDGKGREKLVEVIESIKEDFEKILVITHFEEMKDAFAQRIEVAKGPDGSRIHLI